MTCWHPESRDSFWGREAEETEGRAYKSETVGKKQERRGRGDGGLAAGRRQSQVNKRGWCIGSAPGLLTCMKAPRIFRASW